MELFTVHPQMHFNSPNDWHRPPSLAFSAFTTGLNAISHVHIASTALALGCEYFRKIFCLRIAFEPLSNIMENIFLKVQRILSYI